ncbi:MAG: saccharopine dehydrogenase C-terminal domain-containing protein [Candidatus Ozemobacteraceae bacterium]
MSSILVLGAGLMGRAIAFDMCRQPQVKQVLVTDISDERLAEAKTIVNSSKASFQRLALEDCNGLKQALKGITLTFGATSYQFNRMLTEACIEAGSHFVDLGGNDAIVDSQFELNAQANLKGVAIIPDSGLAPGLAGILGMHVFRQFDVCEEVRLRVGGLPQHPVPPLNYMLVFSVHGLINEYIEPVRIIENGELKTVSGMSGLEEIQFPEPFGTMEAFYTSGGVSTLVKTLHGKIKNLDYKTIRYTGHQAKIQFLMEMGFFDEHRSRLGPTPREMTEELLHQKLTLKDHDLTLLRVWGTGSKDGRNSTLSYEFIDRHDEKNNLTAMMRTTAFPAAIIGNMLLDGTIKDRGVLNQEFVVPVPKLIDELRKRGVELQEKFDR